MGIQVTVSAPELAPDDVRSDAEISSVLAKVRARNPELLARLERDLPNAEPSQLLRAAFAEFTGMPQGDVHLHALEDESF